MQCIKYFIIFHIVCVIETVDVGVKGFIDVSTDPKLDFKLSNIQSESGSIDVTSLEYLKKDEDIAGAKDLRSLTSKFITKPPLTLMPDTSHEELPVESYKVGDITDLAKYAKHVYKNSVSTIKRIRKKLDKSLRSNMLSLEDAYKWKFKEFLNESLGHTVRTKSGPHKLILNTLQTSENILKRLINHLIFNLAKDGKIGNRAYVENILLSEIERKSELEYEYVCKNYKICRANKNFSSFLTDILTILTSLKPDKLKTATNAFTEVLKETDFSKIMDKETDNKFKNNIIKVESLSGWILKPTYSILKNILINRYKPVLLLRQKYLKNSKVSLPMEAIADVLDTFDKFIPATKENHSKWSSSSNSLQEWSEEKRSDILEIAQQIVNQIRKGINAMDVSTRKQMKHHFKHILGK